MDRNCPICSAEASEICFENSLIRAIPSALAVATGHTLIAPRRHVERLADLTDEEHEALFRSIEIVWSRIRGDATDRSIGINDGIEAGQAVPHLHVHLIPRARNDSLSSAGGGGVSTRARSEWERIRAYDAAQSHLFVGDEASPYIDALRGALEDAIAVDLAVAFVSDSGLDLIQRELTGVGRRAGGRVRIVTGDFLGFNEPSTLRRLLAMGAHIECYVATTSVDARFHPKACLIRGLRGESTLFIGSSNLTQAALCTGVEWNCRIAEFEHPSLVQEAKGQFERLVRSPMVERLSESWIADYEGRRRPELLVRSVDDLPSHMQPTRFTPNEVQAKALDALALDRKMGGKAGLVVLATGLGKTFLAAFLRQRENLGKTLFVAHRAEILSQAESTFRRLDERITATYVSGDSSDTSGQLVLASVQKLGRDPVLQRIASDEFDLVVVDEFHHAPASQYRRVLNHFRPKYLLGLTATPDRADEADVLALCGGNVVFRYDLFEAVGSGHLCPFDYFGIADPVEYEQIPWRGRQFELAMLENALQSSQRVQRAITEWRARLGPSRRTLVFCTTVQHLRVMRDAFESTCPGLRCASIHSDVDSDAREQSLNRLRSGDLDLLFSVDMLSEGVDLPEVDGILMLRPTDSPVLFLQQLGRGLRAREGKRLRVVDFVGNHRAFLARAEVLARTTNSRDFLRFLGEIRDSSGRYALPEGCSLEYELAAIDFLERASRSRRPASSLSEWCDGWQSAHQRAPTFVEALDGYFKPGERRDTALQTESWGRIQLSMAQFAGSAEITDASAIEALDSLQRERDVDTAGLLLAQCWLEQDCPVVLEIESVRTWIDGKRERDPRLAPLLATPIGDALHSMVGANTDSAFDQKIGPFWLRGAGEELACSTPSLRAREQVLIEALSDMLFGWIEFRAEEARRALHAQLSEGAISCTRDGGGDIRAKWALVREGDCFRIQVFPRAGGPNPSNDEYSESLQLLLERLSAISAQLVAAYIDTAAVRHLALSQRLVRMDQFAYPVQLDSQTGGQRLQAALQRAQVRVGQREGARGGNQTRGMYMLVRVPGWETIRLKEYLRTGQAR
jgi:superfamily II DNA or RNA helicase/HKD family nuclease